ncbi:MAG: TolC family outer membrane protein [Alphaproteobacteria bacterium]
MTQKIGARKTPFIGALTAMAAVSLLCGTLSAQAADSLEDALAAAYNTNPTLQAERARLRATDENVAQAVSGWRPTITASASYGSQNTRRASGFGGLVPIQRLESNPKTGSLVLNQPIFQGFRTLNSTRQAKAEVRSGRALLLSTEQEVLLNAVTAYIDVVRDQAVTELSQNNVKVLLRQLEAAQDRFEVGEVTRTDVAQAEARLSGARANLTQAEAALITSREAYRRVVGRMPGTLDVPERLPVLPDTEEAAAAIAVERNPALRSAIEAERASEYAVKVAKGALLPRLDFEAAATHTEDQSIAGDQTSGYSFFSEVVIPIYQSGVQYSRIRQLKELNNADRLRVAEVRREVVENVAVAWENLVAARDVIAASREQVRANEIAFEGVVQEAQVGARTTLDVLDAEQELLDAQVTLVRARRDEFVAAFALLAATGQLTAYQLGLPVDYYDPTEHYERIKWRPF